MTSLLLAMWQQADGATYSHQRCVFLMDKRRCSKSLDTVYLIIPKWAQYGTICDEYFTLNESLWSLSRRLHITSTSSGTANKSNNSDIQQLRPLLKDTFLTAFCDESIATNMVTTFFEQIEEQEFNEWELIQ